MLCESVIESEMNKVLQQEEFGFTRSLSVDGVNEKPSRFYVRFIFNDQGHLLEFPVPKTVAEDDLHEELVFRTHKVLTGLRANRRQDYDALCKDRIEYGG